MVLAPEFNCPGQSRGSEAAHLGTQSPLRGGCKGTFGLLAAKWHPITGGCTIDETKEQEKNPKKIQNRTRYDLWLWGATQIARRQMGTNESAGAKQRRIETNQELPWCIAVYRT